MSDDKAHVVLREVTDADLPVFFAHLHDPQAAAMADEDPNDQHGFETRWAKLRRDPEVTPWAIELADSGEVVGHIVGFPDGGEFHVSYWVDRAHWGKGVATGALQTFLERVTRRPVFARTPRHNEAAVVVLKRNGFHMVGEESGYVLERGKVVDELILRHA